MEFFTKKWSIVFIKIQSPFIFKFIYFVRDKKQLDCTYTTTTINGTAVLIIWLFLNFIYSNPRRFGIRWKWLYYKDIH